MIDIINKFPKNWSIIYLGLKNDWLSIEDVFSIINSTLYDKESTDFVVELNLCEEKDEMLNLIQENFSINESLALEIWKLAFLFRIDKSTMLIVEKLKSIAETWARFDYPDEWRAFIHYMPNEDCNSPKEVYESFQAFISKEKNKLDKI